MATKRVGMADMPIPPEFAWGPGTRLLLPGSKRCDNLQQKDEVFDVPFFV
jgi:hypothetical protein